MKLSRKKKTTWTHDGKVIIPNKRILYHLIDRNVPESNPLGYTTSMRLFTVAQVNDRVREFGAIEVCSEYGYAWNAQVTITE